MTTWRCGYCNRLNTKADWNERETPHCWSCLRVKIVKDLYPQELLW